MNPLRFGSVRLISGDLLHRAQRSLARLRQEPYRPDEAIRLAAWQNDGAVVLPFCHPGQYRGQLLHGVLPFDLHSCYPHYAANDQNLVPINPLLPMTDEEALPSRRQILFRSSRAL